MLDLLRFSVRGILKSLKSVMLVAIVCVDVFREALIVFVPWFRCDRLDV